MPLSKAYKTWPTDSNSSQPRLRKRYFWNLYVMFSLIWQIIRILPPCFIWMWFLRLPFENLNLFMPEILFKNRNQKSPKWGRLSSCWESSPSKLVLHQHTCKAWVLKPTLTAPRRTEVRRRRPRTANPNLWTAITVATSKGTTALTRCAQITQMDPMDRLRIKKRRKDG